MQRYYFYTIWPNLYELFSPNFVPQGDIKNCFPASSPSAPILISDNLPSRCSDLYLPSSLAVNYGKKTVKRRQKDENDSKTTRKREWTHRIIIYLDALNRRLPDYWATLISRFIASIPITHNNSIYSATPNYSDFLILLAGQINQMLRWIGFPTFLLICWSDPLYIRAYWHNDKCHF